MTGQHQVDRARRPQPTTPPHAGPRRSAAWAAVSTAARRRSVLLACLATVAVHLVALTRQLGVDEGGFAMVARHWLDRGPFLYGAEWVDRPPGLLAVFAVANHLGPYGVRLSAAALAVLLVAALAWAADAVGGRPAARWAAWTGFALASSQLLDAQRLNGELAAAAFVAVSVAALLRAVRVSRNPRQTVLLGALAGGSAMLAVLVKQNFVDAFVFAGVLLALGSAAPGNRLTYRPREVGTAATAFVAGGLVPAGVTALWASQHGGVGALAYAMYGFRADAAGVMTHESWGGPLSRLGELLLLAGLSGVLLLLAHLAVRHGRRLRAPDPLAWAMAAATAVALAGVVAGANFWAHYLIGLIPMVGLATGLSVNRRMPGWRWSRRLVVLTVLVTAVVSPVTGLALRGPSQAATTGGWVAASAAHGDTVVVPFTHANVIYASGLRPGYPYAWSLPVRALDPRLARLTRTLDGGAAPTWVVRWDAGHPWGLDADGRLDAALRAHYRDVADVCGHQVWLHVGTHRQLAPLPPVTSCGSSAD